MTTGPENLLKAAKGAAIGANVLRKMLASADDGFVKMRVMQVEALIGMLDNMALVFDEMSMAMERDEENAR
jgi:hypothetical protein